MLEQLEGQFTKYEIARIVGARALQIAMDAPILLKISEKELEEINYNPIEIAKRELTSGVLPITVNRPLPKKKESKIKKLTQEEVEELKRREEAKKIDAEKRLKEEAKKAAIEEKAKAKVKEVKPEGEEVTEKKAEGEETEVAEVEEKAEEDEIMELATPEDEVEETSSSTEDEGV